MKKLLMTLALICALAVGAMAQPRAIGARVGYNLEFSYQHSMPTHNMLDVTVGITHAWSRWGYIEANCMYDWIFNIRGNWHWYLGPGAGLGYGYGIYWHEYHYIPLRLNIGGQVGVEYQFKIPLTLSVDWRPMFNLLGIIDVNRDHLYVESPMYSTFFNLAVGVRYRF